jgi:hypothetical protein
MILSGMQDTSLVSGLERAPTPSTTRLSVSLTRSYFQARFADWRGVDRLSPSVGASRVPSLCLLQPPLSGQA